MQYSISFLKADKPDEAEKETAEKLLEAAKAEVLIVPVLKQTLIFDSRYSSLQPHLQLSDDLEKATAW